MESINTNGVDIKKPLGVEAIPSAFSTDTAVRLVGFLRTFWTKLYKDPAFIRYLQGARSLKVAQLYVDMLESLQLLNHTKAPVFHRERWYPIVVRKSEVNKCDAATLKVGKGNAGVIEKPDEGQPEGIYEEGQKLYVGKDNSINGLAMYKLNDDIVDVISCVVDSVADPKVILVKDKDFKISDNSIILREDVDPFNEKSGFPVFDIPEGPDNEEDKEAVLWACDTLIDKNYVFDFSGYAVGLDGKSCETYANIVKSVWDATSDGLSIEHLREVLAALCGIPVVKEKEEQVTSIYESDGFTTVITDKNVYRLGPNEGGYTLRKKVKAGNTLFKGEFLDTSVRIYPFVRSTDDVEKFTEFSAEQFKKDVASMSIPKALIRSADVPGFYVGWDAVPVVFEGYDANDNPKYSFDLGLDDYSHVKYWTGVWSEYEKAGKSMEGCFDGLESGSINQGDICGEIVPIEFFLKNLVGANTLIITVDTDTISEEAPLYDPNFFQAFRKLIPAYVRLYFIEHGTGISDDVDMEAGTEDTVNSNTAFAGQYEDEFEDIEDEVRTKWHRRCRKNEEDDEDYE